MTTPLLPDPQQARVLAHLTGAVLVTGGPGTGKTAVLRERFAQLLEGGADAERVAFVVGSRRARDEAREALLARFQGSLPELRVVTIHGVARHVLNARFRRLDYPEPPDLLPAGDQFALVQELLSEQDPGQWPAYGHMLGMRAFADEVRQFLSRAQEALLTPDDILERAEKAGLGGWKELARFYREYQDVIDGRNVVDFAALLQRAAQVATDGEPLLDHLLVDDYQDSTMAAEAIVAGLAPADLIVAGDADAHVFSFQGATDIPIRRFAERFGGAEVIALETPHRAEGGVTVEAWLAPHTSEEHAAIARELRRLHVEEGVPWNELAVVVRRQGAHVGSLLRALDDSGVPRALPESGMALTAEPATFPYVLALRWLTADGEAREQLIESVLTSDLVRLSPAAARGLMRAAQAIDGTVATAIEHTDGLTQVEASEVETVREVLARATIVSDRSVLDAFRILWQDLPYSARLVAARRSFIRRPARDRRRGRPFRRGRRGRRVARPVHRGIRPRARCRRARARVPQHGSRVVRRRTGVDGARCGGYRARHGHRRGDRRRELPQLVPPGTDVRPGRARTADLAVRAQPRPSGGRTSAVPHDGRAREDAGSADRERDARRRIGRRVEVRRRARCGVVADPPRPVRGAGLGTRGDRHVATHARGP